MQQDVKSRDADVAGAAEKEVVRELRGELVEAAEKIKALEVMHSVYNTLISPGRLMCVTAVARTWHTRQSR